MPASNSKTNTKKSMDIARPGKSVPDDTARPIIVGHKPMVKDPTVKTDEPDITELETEETPVAEPMIHTTKIIEPPKAEEPVIAADPVAADDTVEPTEEATEPSEEPATSSESAEVDALAEQVETGKKNKDEPSEEDKKKQEHIQKLITDKKYFVPIGQVTRRRKNRQALMLLLVLVASATAGYYFKDKLIP